MHYRLYSLDEASGHFIDASDLQVKTDEEAIRVGHETYPEHSFEIWCRARRVLTHHAPVSIARELVTP